MLDDRLIQSHLINEIEKERNSKVLVYFHDDSMSYNHVPLIYNELRKLGKVKNLDIFLSSNGGDPDAAYKIVKMCREHCEENLAVIVPFMAKSAATLLAIGTDEIIMGSPSELGPIDPQISDRKSGFKGATQSIRDCLDFVEERYRASDDLEMTSSIFMPILDKLDPFTLGMFERAVKMSKQYADLLLREGMLNDRTDEEIEGVVKKLNESYYSHGYAINNKEAKEDLFLNVIDYSREDIWEEIWNLYLNFYIQSLQTRDSYVQIETLQSIRNEIMESDEFRSKIEQEDQEDTLQDQNENNESETNENDEGDESSQEDDDDSLS